MASEKQKYLTKTVKFGSGFLTMYSIDGTTWSTRKEELHQIIARHEAERQKLAQLKVDENAEKGAKSDDAAESEEKEEKEEEKSDDIELAAEDDELLPIVDEVDEEIAEKLPKLKKVPAKKLSKPVRAVPKKVPAGKARTSSAKKAAKKPAAAKRKVA